MTGGTEMREGRLAKGLWTAGGFAGWDSEGAGVGGVVIEGGRRGVTTAWFSVCEVIGGTAEGGIDARDGSGRCTLAVGTEWAVGALKGFVSWVCEVGLPFGSVTEARGDGEGLVAKESGDPTSACSDGGLEMAAVAPEDRGQRGAHRADRQRRARAPAQRHRHAPRHEPRDERRVRAGAEGSRPAEGRVRLDRAPAAGPGPGQERGEGGPDGFVVEEVGAFVGSITSGGVGYTMLAPPGSGFRE